MTGEIAQAKSACFEEPSFSSLHVREKKNKQPTQNKRKKKKQTTPTKSNQAKETQNQPTKKPNQTKKQQQQKNPPKNSSTNEEHEQLTWAKMRTGLMVQQT